MIGLVARTIVGRRTKVLVILFWVAVLAVAFPLAGKLAGAEKNDNKAWLPGSAESTKVLDLQAAFQSPNLMPAVVVYDRRGGLTAADRAKISADAPRLAAVAKTQGPLQPPVFARDGAAAETLVPLDLGPNGWEHAGDVVTRMQGIARGDPGLSVHVTGPAGYAADSADVFKSIDSTLLYGTLLVVVTILLITYRSPLLWLLPVLSAGAALTSAQAVIYLLARHAGLTVNGQSAGILTVLVFGASTDYALLLVARYREELRRHADRHQAMLVALRRASPAIVASASTVVLGLLCLVFAELNSTKGLGPVAAIGVAVGLLSMLTLLPALLVTAGRWVFWPFVPKLGSPDPTGDGPWAHMGRRIARRPRPVWVGTVLVLAAMTAGIASLHATGLTTSESYTGHPDSVTGQTVLASHFPGGVGSPVVVIADASSGSAVTRVMASNPGITAVTPPVSAGGKAYLEGTLRAEPDSAAAYRVIDQLRAAVHRIPGAAAAVGGGTAIALDVQRAAAHDRNVVIPIVLLVVLVVLAVLLRALLAPLLLIATVALSFLASLGLSGFVFTHVFGFAGADTALPLYIFVFLVALGIDYNIFLMSRVREEAARQGTRLGAVTALAATGGVITSAGCVLAGTFAVLGTLPLTTFAEIAFAVAFGVLLDAIVVRSVLVTALTVDIGDRIWWPHRMARGPLADAVPPASDELARSR